MVQVMSGTALMMVKRSERNHGHHLAALEAGVRALDRPQGRSDADGHHDAELGARLSARNFNEKVDEWEADLDRYKRQTTELISDPIMVAVVLKHAPHEVQQALRI